MCVPTLPLPLSVSLFLPLPLPSPLCCGAQVEIKRQLSVLFLLLSALLSHLAGPWVGTPLVVLWKHASILVSFWGVALGLAGWDPELQARRLYLKDVVV